MPPKCGGCQKQKALNEQRPRHLAAVSSPMKRCIVHDQSYTRVCTGCAADEKAVS